MFPAADKKDAYMGLGVLGEGDYSTGGLIGGVKSSDQCNFGLRLNANDHCIAGLGLGLIGPVQVTDEVTVRANADADTSKIIQTIKDAIGNTKLKPELLGVYRPNLEDRKVGKVGMHMVIDGFPRALREVAKVMTWAADAKGYKLHDWRNLPNAEVDFPAAEYRHQSDSCIMKAEGTPAIERTDHESNLLHAAHKVFNSLAELELILAGVIK